MAGKRRPHMLALGIFAVGTFGVFFMSQGCAKQPAQRVAAPPPPAAASPAPAAGTSQADKVQAPASGGAGLAAGQNVAPAASAPVKPAPPSDFAPVSQLEDIHFGAGAGTAGGTSSSSRAKSRANCGFERCAYGDARRRAAARTSLALQSLNWTRPASSPTTPRSFSWPTSGPAVGYVQGGRVWLFVGITYALLMQPVSAHFLALTWDPGHD